MPFTAALASAIAEGDGCYDRGPTGSGKTQGAMWKYDSTGVYDVGPGG